MKFNIIVFYILTFYFSLPSLVGQESNLDKSTLSGYITNEENGEKLIGAHIYCHELSVGTVTNEYGFYTITIPKGSYHIEYSYIGYVPISYSIDLQSDKTLEVVANREDGSAEIEKSQMSTISVPIEQIEALPSIGGEVDVIRSMQLLPGIQSGSEGSSGLHVRGGAPDQNLILLDGVPVYNASHLFGFLSVFNSDAINKVEIIKGGFPARFGGRLSSVVDIRMKEGNIKKFSGSGSISPIATKLLFEGPIIKDKMSFMVTGRRTFLDLFLGNEKTKQYGQVQASRKTKYYFYDLNGKINYQISNRDRVYLSLYNGKDKLTYIQSHHNEYFADLSVLFFGGSVYYPPFNLEGVTPIDSQGLSVIKEAWGR